MTGVGVRELTASLRVYFSIIRYDERFSFAMAPREGCNRGSNTIPTGTDRRVLLEMKR